MIQVIMNFKKETQNPDLGMGVEPENTIASLSHGIIPNIMKSPLRNFFI